MSAFLAVALLGVLAATLIHSARGATALLCAVAIVFAIGECIHAFVLGPVVADLAPPHLLGRYISLYSLMVTGGFALGPAIGGALQPSAPDAVWWGGADGRERWLEPDLRRCACRRLPPRRWTCAKS